jgi:hypothetical protein
MRPVVAAALLSALAGATAFVFVHGHWDFDGWLAAVPAGFTGILVKRRNRRA